MRTMRAAVCTAYGGPEVVEIREVPAPVPKDDEILIRVRATTVSSGDSRIRRSNFPGGFWLPARLALGLTRPRQPIFGRECAGVVDAVGGKVTRFRPGDHVFVLSGGGGCHAEFKAMREDAAVALKPAGFSFEEAAAISFGGTTALHYLSRVGKMQRGERVLVNGAAGAVGTAGVQLAKHFGGHVTGVTSVRNAELVRSLGADAVIDYSVVDFAKGGERWDLILDTVGNAPFSRSRDALTDKGRLLAVVGTLAELIKAPFQSMTGSRKVFAGISPELAADLDELRTLGEAGAFKPVIGSRFPFARIVEAYAHADTGHKVGSVVVVMDGP